MRASRWRRWELALVATVTLGVVAACGSETAPQAGSGGSGATSAETAPGTTTAVGAPTTDALAGSAGEVVARASRRTQEFETGRMSVRKRVTVDDGPGTEVTVDLVGSGSFDQGGRRHEQSMEVTAEVAAVSSIAGEPFPEGVGVVVRQVVDESTVHLRYDVTAGSPDAAALLGDVYEGWASYEVPEEAESMNVETLELSASPLGYLEALLGAEPAVIELGESEIDGVAVTGYRGTIDPVAALSAAPATDRQATEQRLVEIGFHRFADMPAGALDPRPFEVWIDEGGIVRRMALTLMREIPDHVFIQPTVTIDYLDLGEDVSVEPPPPDEVRPMIEVLIEGMRRGG